MNDGFEAFGHPVPDHRLEEAYRQARAMGMNASSAMEVVGKAVRAIESDQPYRILGTTDVGGLDLTGRYRLVAVLCTAEHQ